MPTDTGFCLRRTYKTESDGFSSLSVQNPLLMSLHWGLFRQDPCSVITGNLEAGVRFLLVRGVCGGFFSTKLYITEIFSTGSTKAQHNM